MSNPALQELLAVRGLEDGVAPTITGTDPVYSTHYRVGETGAAALGAAGTAVFHHGDMWHGSGPNLSDHPRRAVVSHCVRHDTTFHPRNNSQIYSRYRQFDTLAMPDSYFPILWTDSGERTQIIQNLRSFCV